MEPLDLRLKSWGYSPFFSQAFSSLERPEWSPARVVSAMGARLELKGVDAPFARVSGRLRHALLPPELPTVGDWVAVADDIDGVATIHHVLPRRTCLVRRAAGRRDDEQTVAANVDLFFIVTSANRDANARRLERYLTAVWDSGARPVVVLNKIDLASTSEIEDELGTLAAAAPGVTVIGCSAHRGDGLEELAKFATEGTTVALVGSSGVGKSSLINRWLGRDAQGVLGVDDVDRGRHTTTRRQLFMLPNGGLAVDTPGMRSFGLLDSEEGLDVTFADVSELAEGCRFRDCRHEGEPGCAVASAIDAGELDPSRLTGLQKLERELQAVERRRDPAALREHKAHWKAIHMSQRARAKVDPKLKR